MSFFAQSGIVGVPLLVLLLVVLAQVAWVVRGRLRRSEGPADGSRVGAILVVGVVGACIGLLATLIGVWVGAGVITSAGEGSTALAWSMIRVAMTPSIMGFSILGVASVAWIVLHYWGARRSHARFASDSCSSSPGAR